jgi:hypothetical protein
MNNKYTLENCDATEKRIRKQQKERMTRISDCQVEELDCCVSMSVENSTLSEIKLIRAIIEGRGRWEFEALELHTIEGEPTRSKKCRTKFGHAFRVEHANGTIEWVNPYVKSKTLAKKGYKTVNRIYSAPAMTKFETYSSGMAGVCSGSYNVIPCKFNQVTQKEEGEELIRYEDYEF